MPTHRIMIITTGGTIAGNVADDKKGVFIEDPEKADDPRRNAEDFTTAVSPFMGHFNKAWGINIEFSSEAVCNVDSSDVEPYHWTAIVDLIKKHYNEHDSFIITHGTNTMGYTCAALSFAIANSNKPIIVTGSQVPSDMPGSDALSNLNNAIRVALWPHQPTVKGVVAVFGSHIISGTRVKKSTEFDYDAFGTFQDASIGRIGRIVTFDLSKLQKHLSYLESPYYNMALTADDLIVENDFETRIASLTEFPGMPDDIFKNLVEHNDIKGFILRAFGAGDASHRLHAGLDYLKQKEIPIVLTTQAPNGNSNFQVNEPGQHINEKKLAIPAFDMSIEAQTTKLAWLLAKRQKGEIGYQDVCREMVNDIRGEITVLRELKQ